LKRKLLVLLMLFGLIAAACGDDDSNGGDGGGGGEGGEIEGEMLPQVQLAIDNDDFMNQLAWIVANERYWPDLGFQEDAEVFASDEYLAGLFGGDVWVAQGESDVIWAALAEGSVPLKIIGVEKDTEAFFLGVAEGVNPDDLSGLKISGGPPGDRNITVGERILEDMGYSPDDLEWVSVDGGSDERLTALIAGQIDVAVLQPRHIIPLEDAGGEMIHQEYEDSPQEVWVVKQETLDNNEPAVCAYLEGRIAAKQWIGEGENYTDNQDAAIALAEGDPYNLDPSEGDLSEWEAEITGNWSMDGGSPAESFEQWTEDMIANENVPEDFDWTEHVDFDCLWQAQETLGLDQNPVPEEVE
jgi:ABC-type nitrate/sulfonate/bicarbonate transport system substrate-binding protein